MQYHIHRKGFDHLTGMAWCIIISDDYSHLNPTPLLLPQKNPNVIMRVDYMDTWPPRLFKKNADGWVECHSEFEKKDGECFYYTSGETHPLGANKELDYLHAALVALLPHP